MFKFIITDIFALLIDREWREEILCDMWDLHERMIRGKYKNNKYFASFITLIRVISIIIFMPISIQSILSNSKKKILDIYGRFVSSAGLCFKISRGFLTGNFTRLTKDNLDSEKVVIVVDYVTTIDIRDYILEPRKKQNINAKSTMSSRIVKKLNEGYFCVVSGFLDGDMKFIDTKDFQNYPLMTNNKNNIIAAVHS